MDVFSKTSCGSDGSGVGAIEGMENAISGASSVGKDMCGGWGSDIGVIESVGVGIGSGLATTSLDGTVKGEGANEIADDVRTIKDSDDTCSGSSSSGP